MNTDINIILIMKNEKRLFLRILYNRRPNNEVIKDKTNWIS